MEQPDPIPEFPVFESFLEGLLQSPLGDGVFPHLTAEDLAEVYQETKDECTHLTPEQFAKIIYQIVKDAGGPVWEGTIDTLPGDEIDACASALLSQNPQPTKVCENCGITVVQSRPICPNCRGYRFDPAP